MPLSPYVAALKERIQALPGNQFVQAWACIEDIEAAITKAGPTAMLALAYVRTVQDEHLAEILGMQEARIANMVRSAVSQHENILALATSRNAAFDEIEKLKKRLARSKPAKKTKRKA